MKSSSSDAKRARLSDEVEPAEEPPLPADELMGEEFTAWQCVKVAWRGDELKVLKRSAEFVVLKKTFASQILLLGQGGHCTATRGSCGIGTRGS